MPKMPLHYQRAALSPEVERAFAHLADDPIGLVTSDAAAGRKTVSATIDPGKGGLSSFAWDGRHLSLTGGFAALLEVTFWVARITDPTVPAWSTVLGSFAPYYTHFRSFRNGILQLSDLAFFGGVIYVSLHAATRVLQGQRWR